MQTTLRKMGNSTGMILPKALLQEAGVKAGTVIDVRFEDGRFVATPRRSPREGWAEDAARIGALGLTPEEQEWVAFGSEGDDELAW